MEIVPLPAFEDNYIWALIEGSCCVVVDPGDAGPVLDFLARRSLALEAILVTHRHPDHIAGIPALRAQHPAPVYGPAGVAGVTEPADEGFRITLCGLALQVWAVPGHTEEHIAWLAPGLIFCGDTLFAAGCGRIKGSASAATFHASLARIASLPDDTLIYCTHEYTLANLRFAACVEPTNAAIAARSERVRAQREAGQVSLPSRLAEERLSNPYLRCAEPAVRAATEVHAGRPLQDDHAVFAALRAWKDGFRG